MNALTECYSNASIWDIRRQILSIMADMVTFQTLKKWIPDLTGYRFSTARKAYICIASRERRFTTTGTPNKVVRVTHRGRPILGFSLVLLVLTLSRTCHSVRRPSHCPQRYPYVHPRVHCKTIPCICRGILFYSSQPQNSVKTFFLFVQLLQESPYKVSTISVQQELRPFKILPV